MRRTLLLALVVLGLAVAPGCGDGTRPADVFDADTAADADAGQDDGDPVVCGAAPCQDGCCLNGECQGADATHCGRFGAACLDCTADGRADACVDGSCVCAATGALCEVGSSCTATGCGACEPACLGRCAGADDGCGGSCPSTDCPLGCCDSNGLCVAVSSQNAARCGASGATCADCTTDAGADACNGGVCVCAATGAHCGGGQACTATGCGGCQPSCVGKCAGADNGCGGTCSTTDCATGCCDSAGVCHTAQADDACGAGGQACFDCVAHALSCDSGRCSSGRAYDARFVDQSVPNILSPGQTASVTVTMQNVGSATWSADDEIKLGAQNPQDSTMWGFSRVTLAAGQTVAPGASATFSFDVTAPTSPGIYRFHWRMLQEGVVWFGEFSEFAPVRVGTPAVTVCEAARGLAGTNSDASGAIQGCIDAAPGGAAVALPAGVYRVDHPVVIAARPITLSTEGLDLTDPTCALANHDCAELRASTAFTETLGILQVLSPGSVVDHLVIHGNKTARTSTPSGTQCAGGSNGYGYNMRLACSNCTMTRSVTQEALCGTGLELSGAGSGVVVWQTVVANNGVHNQEGLWSDGLTAHDYGDTTIASNEFLDNTDVDLIFGGCPGCYIQRNRLRHSTTFAGSAFAALMLHAWPDGATSGNFDGADTSLNDIDCGASRRCGIGLYLGSDAWYIADVHGGTVHRNQVRNALLGVLLDDVHDMAVYDNVAQGSATSMKASCGTKSTSNYGKGNRTTALDTSLETLGTTYTAMNYDLCIPNWWK